MLLDISCLLYILKSDTLFNMFDLLKSYVPTKVGIRQFADITLLNLLLILYDDVFFLKDSYFH